MRTLIVPDIHESIVRFDREIVPRIGDADRTIFLGDWFDTFYEKRQVEVCDRILEYVFRDDVTMLLGNHDCHYFFDNRGFMCSGYDAVTKVIVRDNISPQAIDRFRIYTMDQGYILSHAGFHENTIGFANQAVELAALDTAKRGGFDAIFEPGNARGGRAMVGGPTWLDWSWEFGPGVEGVKQIVGHTHDKQPRQTGNNWCIDTGLHHVGWIEDGNFTVEAL